MSALSTLESGKSLILLQLSFLLPALLHLRVESKLGMKDAQNRMKSRKKQTAPEIQGLLLSVEMSYALEVALLTTCEKALGSRTARSAKTLRFRMISEVRSALIRRL